ncbi:MAG: hypothetical protein ACOZQL_18565 [Myxococcota bacterium]
MACAQQAAETRRADEGPCEDAPLEVRFDPLVAGASHEQVADLTPADLLEYRSR